MTKRFILLFVLTGCDAGDIATEQFSPDITLSEEESVADTATAVCPDGYLAVSGGCNCKGGLNARLQASFAAQHDRWLCQCIDSDTTAAQVVCIK